MSFRSLKCSRIIADTDNLVAGNQSMPRQLSYAMNATHV